MCSICLLCLPHAVFIRLHVTKHIGSQHHTSALNRVSATYDGMWCLKPFNSQLEVKRKCKSQLYAKSVCDACQDGQQTESTPPGASSSSASIAVVAQGTAADTPEQEGAVDGDGREPEFGCFGSNSSGSSILDSLVRFYFQEACAAQKRFQDSA